MLISCRLNRVTLRLFQVSLSAVLILTPLMFALTSVSRAAHPINLTTPFGNNLLTAHNVGMTVGPLLLNSIAASPSTVSVGGPLAVTWNIPSNQSQTDWVGLYRSGAPDTAGRELWWMYTGGSPTGSFTLNAPLEAGQYQFRFLLNNSFSHVATSNSVTVSSTPTPTPTPTSVPSYSIAASPSAVAVGGPLAVTWNIPSNQSQTDWVGLYRVGAPHIAGNELWWRYTAGSPTGSFTLNAPLVAGQYEFRLSLNNSFNNVATSNSVTVSSTPTPTPTPLPTPPPTTDGAQFYVSPSGSSSGDGSINNPWSIWKAIVTPGVVPAGSTVYLRGGTYSMDPNPQPDRVLWEIAGTAAQPIIVRNYPGERVLIDMDWLVEFYGDYVHYWGLEFFTSRTKRVFSGGAVNDIPGAISFAGKGIKLINSVLHDAHGASLFSAAEDIEMYGNIMYYHGLIAQERSWGTVAYIQNNVGYKRLTDNIFFQQFNHNIQATGSDIATTQDIYLVGNTIFSAGTLGTNPGWNAVVWVGAIPAERITFSDNYVYQPPLPDITWTTPNVVMWGSRESTNTDLVFTGNRIVRGYPPVRLARWSPATFTDNTIVGEAGTITAAGIVGLDNTLVPNGQYNWNNNRYHQGAAGYQFQYPGGYYDFAGWKVVTGLDTNSTYSASRPTGMD
nr:hypothetical protein [Pyrinomonadaceae bacterium]